MLTLFCTSISMPRQRSNEPIGMTESADRLYARTWARDSNRTTRSYKLISCAQHWARMHVRKVQQQCYRRFDPLAMDWKGLKYSYVAFSCTRACMPRTCLQLAAKYVSKTSVGALLFTRYEDWKGSKYLSEKPHKCCVPEACGTENGSAPLPTGLWTAVQGKDAHTEFAE